MENEIISGYAPVNGIDMYYQIHGDGGTPLLLIHGGGSTIESSFGNLLPLLKAHYQIIALELQAHGRTSDRPEQETFEQDAADVAAFMQYLKIPKVNMLGFSNGGTTTMQIAAGYPDLVNKIILVAGAYRRDGFIDGFFDGMQHASLDNMPAPLKTAYLEVSADESKFEMMFEKDKQRMIHFRDMPDEMLSSIKAPALFIVADQDVITIEHTVKMSKLVPVARVAVLPGIHGSAIGEVCTHQKNSRQPEITVTLVQTFLDS